MTAIDRVWFSLSALIGLLITPVVDEFRIEKKGQYDIMSLP